MLADLGLRPVEVSCDDRFRFGDGRVIRASRSWKYPFGIYGRNGVLNVAEVPQEECPPFLSAKCMGELGVVMDFKEKAVTVAGDTRPMQMLSSGDLALDVGEYEDTCNFDQEFLLVAETAEDEAPGGVVKRDVRKRLTRVATAVAVRCSTEWIVRSSINTSYLRPRKLIPTDFNLPNMRLQHT
jgi:hypothetical protein